MPTIGFKKKNAKRGVINIRDHERFVLAFSMISQELGITKVDMVRDALKSKFPQLPRRFKLLMQMDDQQLQAYIDSWRSQNGGV